MSYLYEDGVDASDNNVGDLFLFEDQAPFINEMMITEKKIWKATTVRQDQQSNNEKGQALPKFGDWNVNDPSSAEEFTVIFDKARDEKKTGSKPDSPGRLDHQIKHGVDLTKPQSKKWFCCMP